MTTSDTSSELIHICSQNRFCGLKGGIPDASKEKGKETGQEKGSQEKEALRRDPQKSGAVTVLPQD